MKLWNTVERTIMDFMNEADENKVYDDYGFEYKGTMPLDFEKFPLVQSIYEEGKGSNFVTAYDTDDLDNPTKWILYPTTVDGKKLNSEQIDSLLHANEHFGIYDSYDKMKEVDNNIHNHFNKLSKESDPEYDIKSGPVIKGKDGSGR